MKARANGSGMLRVAGAVSALALIGGAAAANDEVVLQLRWDHQFQFAGYYAADWQGYYEDAGLDVEIRSGFTEGGERLNVIDEVAAGNADCGIGAADVLRAQSEGHDLPILTSVFQESGIAVVMLEENATDSVEDLTEMRVGRKVGNMSDLEFQLMLREMGIDPEAVSAIEPAHDFSDLFAGEIDARVGWLISAVQYAKQRDVEIDWITADANGVETYGDAIFCSRSFVDERPGVAKRFVEASLQGWEYALLHPTEVSDRIAADLPRALMVENPTEFNRDMIDVVVGLTQFPEVPLGRTDPERWQEMLVAFGEAQIFELDLGVRLAPVLEAPSEAEVTVQ